VAAQVGYGRYGQSVAGFLPASMPNGIGKRLVGVGLCYHICVSFLLTFQPRECLPPSALVQTAGRSAGRF
jgi:hypothetical protein